MKDCIFSCATHGGNGDDVEGTSCGSKSNDDDVCLHWETHVVQWEVARKKNAIFKRKIAFLFLCLSWWQWRLCRRDFVWFKVKA